MLPPQSNHTIHQIQTDYIDIELSKVFTVYIKKIEHHNSQRANQYSQMNFFL